VAVKPQIVTDALSTTGRGSGNHVNFICTTQAELPSSNVIDGDTAFAQDTGNPFTRTGGSVGVGRSAAAIAFGNIAVDVAYSAADVICLSASANGGIVRMDGIIHNGANAGNFNFRWAQNTSTALNTSVLSGSHISYRKVN